MEPKLYYWCVYNNVKADILKYLSLSYNKYMHTCIPPFAEIPGYASASHSAFLFVPCYLFLAFVFVLVLLSWLE